MSVRKELEKIKQHESNKGREKVIPKKLRKRCKTVKKCTRNSQSRHKKEGKRSKDEERRRDKSGNGNSIFSYTGMQCK